MIGELPEKLRKSILQEAIQGKLVPQDPNDEPAEKLLERIWEGRALSRPKDQNGRGRSPSAPHGRGRSPSAPHGMSPTAAPCSDVPAALTQRTQRAQRGAKSLCAFADSAFSVSASAGKTFPPIPDEDPSSVALAKEEKPFPLPKGWAWCRLGDVANVLAGYPFDGNGYVNAGIKICGGLIIMPNGIKWPECKYWPNAQGLENFLLKDGDIVVALDRPWINGGTKVGLIKSIDLPCLLIQRTARIRSLGVLPQYLMMLLRQPDLKRHCSITEMTVPHISHKDIQTFPIPLPPLAEQKRIVAKVEELLSDVERLKKGAA